MPTPIPSASMDLLFRRVTVVTPWEEIRDAHVAVKDGRITMVGQGDVPVEVAASPGAHPIIYDAPGLTLCPGFIDLHVHGGGGSDTMDGDTSALLNIARTHATGGTTRLLATTVSAPSADIKGALSAIAEACELSRTNAWHGACIIGAHMEGPFLSQRYRGAHPAELVRPIDMCELSDCVESARGTMRMVTFAPELPGAVEAAAYLHSIGVLPVIGHSGASFEEACEAIAAGMTHVTHVMNGMQGLHHRNPGVLGAILASQSVSVQIIADGLHLHPSIVRILIACKGVSNSILITDGMEAVGLPDGKYGLASAAVTVKDGLCTLADGTIAGSTLTMNCAVRNVIKSGAATRLEAISMASLVPATILGYASEMGSIEVGKLADMTLVDDEFRVHSTFVAGRLVYEAPAIPTLN